MFDPTLDAAPPSTEATGTIFRLKVEDADLDELLRPWDVYTSRHEAFVAIAMVIADPPPGAGSVYLTQDDGDDEVVIASHYFIASQPSR